MKLGQKGYTYYQNGIQIILELLFDIYVTYNHSKLNVLHLKTSLWIISSYPLDLFHYLLDIFFQVAQSIVVLQLHLLYNAKNLNHYL